MSKLGSDSLRLLTDEELRRTIEMQNFRRGLKDTHAVPPLPEPTYHALVAEWDRRQQNYEAEFKRAQEILNEVAESSGAINYGPYKIVDFDLGTDPYLEIKNLKRQVKLLTNLLIHLHHNERTDKSS